MIAPNQPFFSLRRPPSTSLKCLSTQKHPKVQISSSNQAFLQHSSSHYFYFIFPIKALFSSSNFFFFLLFFHLVSSSNNNLSKFENQRKGPLVVKIQLFIKTFNGQDLIDLTAYLHYENQRNNVLWPKICFRPFRNLTKNLNFDLIVHSGF